VTRQVAGLLLAAGAGTRLGRPKAMLSMGGATFVERGVALLRDGGCDPLVVVGGAVPLDVAGAQVVTNPQWASGMGSSLRAGLTALARGDAAAVVIALVDQPRVSAEAVRRLRRAHDAGAVVAVAAYAGVGRNPVLLDRRTWEEVARLAEGDVGARPFLRAHPELVTLVECGDVAAPDDVDTPADLTRLDGSAPAPETH
jgi:nicotine blue oxidoreductase